jgi:hypothetical protein
VIGFGRDFSVKKFPAAALREKEVGNRIEAGGADFAG